LSAPEDLRRSPTTLTHAITSHKVKISGLDGTVIKEESDK
jgi:hypothetical protein